MGIINNIIRFLYVCFVDGSVSVQVIEDDRMCVRYRSEFKTISRTWNGQLRYVMV